MIGVLVIVILLIIMIIVSIVIYCIELNLLKNLGEIDIEIVDNEIGIVDKGVRRILLRGIKRTITSFKRIYNNQEWENKRFLHSIISEISLLEIKLYNNKLTELEIEKISTIIEIIQTNKGFSSICDKIIFEWEKKYIDKK